MKRIGTRRCTAMFVVVASVAAHGGDRTGGGPRGPGRRRHLRAPLPRGLGSRHRRLHRADQHGGERHRRLRLVVHRRASPRCCRPGSTIPAGGRIVVSPDATRFSALYGFAPDAIYTGKLSNSGETVAARRRRARRSSTPVSYLDASPWPGTPDGTGPSLELRDLHVRQHAARELGREHGRPAARRAPRNSVEGHPDRSSQVTATPPRPDPNQAVVVSARLPIGATAHAHLQGDVRRRRHGPVPRRRREPRRRRRRRVRRARSPARPPGQLDPLPHRRRRARPIAIASPDAERHDPLPRRRREEPGGRRRSCRSSSGSWRTRSTTTSSPTTATTTYQGAGGHRVQRRRLRQRAG